MGDIGTSYIASWVGDDRSPSARAVSAFACCLACVVGASRLLCRRRARHRTRQPARQHRSHDTPAAAAVAITVVITVIALICAVFFDAVPFDTFLWSGTIGTLILLVAYVLATIGCIKLIFIDKKMAVPKWQIVDPACSRW